MPLPEGWPSNVEFIDKHVYSDLVSEALQRDFHTPTLSTAEWAKVDSADIALPSNRVCIRSIVHLDHPAHGQYGLFAACNLPPATIILPYFGLIHTSAAQDTDESSDYDLSLDRDLGLSIDAAKIGNEARFINDYRGIADRPNAEFRDCWVRMPKKSSKQWQRMMAVFVLSAGKAGKRYRGIIQGQEILVNYGRSFWSERNRVDHTG